MNKIVEKAMYAGIGFAVVTKEKMQEFVDELIVKGQEYKNQEEEIDLDATNEVEEEQAEMEENAEENKFQAIREEWEQKFRNFMDNIVNRFNNLTKNEEQDEIAKRIDVLEDKLSKLAEEATDETSEEA